MICPSTFLFVFSVFFMVLMNDDEWQYKYDCQCVHNVIIVIYIQQVFTFIQPVPVFSVMNAQFTGCESTEQIHLQIGLFITYIHTMLYLFSILSVFAWFLFVIVCSKSKINADSNEPRLLFDWHRCRGLGHRPNKWYQDNNVYISWYR